PAFVSLPAYLDVFEHLLLLFGGCDRSHVRLLIDRIPDPQLLRSRGEVLEDLVVALLMDDEPRSRGASLTGRAKGAEHDAVHQEPEVRIDHREDWILAAQLEADLDHLLRGAL